MLPLLVFLIICRVSHGLIRYVPTPTTDLKGLNCWERERGCCLWMIIETEADKETETRERQVATTDRQRERERERERESINFDSLLYSAVFILFTMIPMTMKIRGATSFPPSFYLNLPYHPQQQQHCRHHVGRRLCFREMLYFNDFIRVHDRFTMHHRFCYSVLTHFWW